MTTTVLSIGSNLGDRSAHLQSVLDALGAAVRAVSPVYETAAWGGVEQGPFLNAVVVADDPARDAHAWLARAHEIEDAARRVRTQHWGPRTLDVDLVQVRTDDGEVTVDDDVLTLPHRHAHQRAFVLVPWLAVEPDATLTQTGSRVAVATLLAGLKPAERAGVRETDLQLVVR
ncbi:2-amino-4-hydroxy-6-hydroxymethyldihydropteridine diphosphokinase [Mycolicibacterium duvalii]|uniref:2-amino-4-hydroxy-6-hydroxymethyldihydropteridine diphosphokinase n=1 Tax=Mycolicibacterium duvalii TaxID=39688 RepID=A0A7I7K7C6_9MYCO|nr:2-amino-4-hydroxy-6-hydroxymethyldihydropteridine diphosphokinase [Mycolicibacterium duvalii]MCV7371078.1 2-amino-4-hydroxy-6-hydroxymethyldihydropteridine diphosphokinase [Mycolicibacterium duvalii]PEG37160.1 2-amino-4-hydroxy-6-hydroxymethyldihydropteridine diphosphokinase [Mycolicibacterium duvalii]BBX19995.1 2-amino-4-hydroxy-6-hydroxymethyldihydropteridine diphosphokinase [Mycolicibacterium duvalii]